MSGLAEERKLFHSEADFQHALAWKIHALIPNAQIRLEVSSGRFDKPERIDILVVNAGKTYAIELKYKKKRLQYEYADEVFSLSNDGAQDIGRYDFIKDIARLERYVESKEEAVGYAILLTNDDLYWRTSVRGINSAAYFLHDGRIIESSSTLAWHESTGHGTMKGRTDSFVLHIRQTLAWKDYSKIPDIRDGTFRYLPIKIAR